MTELALSLQGEISKKHAQGVAADNELREALFKKLELTRQCGLLLDEAQDQFGRNGAWKEFAEKLPFDRKVIEQYLKFAHRHPDPITDLKAAMRYAVEAALTTGLLPMGEFATQESHDPPPFLQWSARFVMEFKIRFGKYLAAKPLACWSRAEVEQFLFGLQPIIKVYRRASERLKKT